MCLSAPFAPLYLAAHWLPFSPIVVADMARKHIQNVNARRIVESVARQTLDDIDWQQRDRIVAAHNERDLQAWHEQNERDKLRRKLLAIAAPLLDTN